MEESVGLPQRSFGLFAAIRKGITKKRMPVQSSSSFVTWDIELLGCQNSSSWGNLCHSGLARWGWDFYLKDWKDRPSRWQRSKTWRSPSSPQTHQKYIYMWNNSYRAPTERWQKTSDFPKGKKLLTYLGRTKEKRKYRDKGIGMGPAPVRGSCEGGKVSTH